MLCNHFKIVVCLFALFSLGENYQIQPRIVNGTPSERGQFPFYVYLCTKSAPKNISLCGGTLLNRDFVVTAAHCLYHAKEITIHLGSLKRLRREKGRQKLLANRKNFFIHPGFIYGQFQHDIGLIKLPERAIYSDLIQPVSFPNIWQVIEGMSLNVIGYGLNETNGRPAETLQYTTLKTIPQRLCNNMYLRMESGPATFFCTIGLKNNAICRGKNSKITYKEAFY